MRRMFGDLTVVSAYIGLLTITNPVGNLPIFFQLIDRQTPAQRRTTIFVVGIAVFTILAVAIYSAPKFSGRLASISPRSASPGTLSSRFSPGRC